MYVHNNIMSTVPNSETQIHVKNILLLIRMDTGFKDEPPSPT